MTRIVFYVSDHGFGHATRFISIIRELAKNKNLKIYIKTGQPLSFIEESLQGYSNLEFIHSLNDIGLILKENSFVVDREKMQLEVENWVSDWDSIIEREVSFLRKNDIDLIISDITPWAFLAAKKADISSIAISNFTWYDQYKELLKEGSAVERVGEAYKKADLFLRYPLHLDIEKADQYEDIGFLCRDFDQEKIKAIRKQMAGDKKLVYVGIGKSVDYQLLNSVDFSKYRHFNWLFSAGADIEGDNIYKIPLDDTEGQNYIAACDYAISKAGWSTVSELVLARVPMLLIKRKEIPEDTKIISDIERMGLGKSIEIEDFYKSNIKDRLKGLDKLNLKKKNYSNLKQKVAERIMEFINNMD